MSTVYDYLLVGIGIVLLAALVVHPASVALAIPLVGYALFGQPPASASAKRS